MGEGKVENICWGIRAVDQKLGKWAAAMDSLDAGVSLRSQTTFRQCWAPFCVT